MKNNLPTQSKIVLFRISHDLIECKEFGKLGVNGSAFSQKKELFHTKALHSIVTD